MIILTDILSFFFTYPNMHKKMKCVFGVYKPSQVGLGFARHEILLHKIWDKPASIC